MSRPRAGQAFAEGFRRRLHSGTALLRTEARTALHQARGLVLAECDALVLVTAYWAHRSAFAPKERCLWERFLTGELPRQIAPSTHSGTPSPDPAEQPEPHGWTYVDEEATYRSFPGQAFADAISWEDPVQGEAGDCFLIAALSALARRGPEHIRRLLRDNGDGTFTATFFGRSAESEPWMPCEVTIDGQLPSVAGGWLFARGSNPRDLWPALMEKAYAKWKGDYLFAYDAADSMPGDVLSALTGQPSHVVCILPSCSPRAVLRTLEELLSSGATVLAGTRCHAEPPAGLGLEAGHEYAVFEVDPALGRVLLRDPRGGGAAHGLMWVDARAFTDHFDWVNFVEGGSPLPLPVRSRADEPRPGREEAGPFSGGGSGAAPPRPG